jgi:hypothetical protein
MRELEDIKNEINELLLMTDIEFSNSDDEFDEDSVAKDVEK